VILA